MSEKIENNSGKNIEKNKWDTLSDERLKQIKFLNKSGYQNKQFVEHAYNQGYSSKDSNPNIRRTSAYINKLERVIGAPEERSERQVRAEKYLWDRAVESLVIKSENITDDYWRQQERILRNGGNGRILSKNEKEYLTKDIQAKQYESAKAWADYLSDEDNLYPAWFKLYAWDGMSKMGVFDKDRRVFSKRDEYSVAPYPNLNPEALAKTYDITSSYIDGEVPNDEVLSELLESGNFNKIYSKLMLEQKIIVKTPEKAEDVVGEWKEYGIDDIKELCEAAEGTGWCIASPSMAKGYLGNGIKEKFFLFHLIDPSTGRLADSAAASIRLDEDGEVGEVSGLVRNNTEYQGLEDSLIPTVEQKLFDLPGGEEYLKKIADKKKLIEMDEKYQAGEIFSDDEIEFILEAKRKINQLNKYGEDIRIKEFRENIAENFEKYKDMVDADVLVSKLDSWCIAENFKFLLDRGADANRVVDKIYLHINIAKNLQFLLDHGANIDTVIEKMYSSDVAKNLQFLLDQGANIDAVVKNMYSPSVTKNLQFLLDQGADINGVIRRLEGGYIAENLQFLLDQGANIDTVVENMYSPDVTKNLQFLLDQGANIDIAVKKMYDSDVAENLQFLLDHGANIDTVVEKMYSFDVAENLQFLLGQGANIDGVVRSMFPSDILENIRLLVDRGASIDLIFERLDDDYYNDRIAKNFRIFVENGVDSRRIFSRMGTIYDDDVKKFLDQGAEINDFLGNIDGDYIAKNLQFLLDHGANIDAVVGNMYGPDIAENLQFLLDHGANANRVIQSLVSGDIAKNLQFLLDHGADVDEMVYGMYDSDIAENLQFLLDHGADVNRIVWSMKADDLIEYTRFLVDRGASIDEISKRIDDLRSRTEDLRSRTEDEVEEYNIEDYL